MGDCSRGDGVKRIARSYRFSSIELIDYVGCGFVTWMGRLKIIGLPIAIAMLGWAQGTPPTLDDQVKQEPPVPETTAARSFPFEVAGYVNFRYVNDDAFQNRYFYREYSASLFLSKTVGRWRFHSEFNADTTPEYDSEGIHLFPRRPSLSIKLDNAFVNYDARDWLQVQAGFLFIPNYWRTHRYQSTTLTVDEPSIDQNIFPTALEGGAIHGDKYWADGGVSYTVYGGVDQLSEFQENTQIVKTDRSRVIGGKLTFHVPSRQFFRTLDVSFHRLRRNGGDSSPDEMYALELQLSRDRFELLGEFDHAAMEMADGVRGYIRQGYYVQPSYRITPKLFAVLRYDRLDRDSRFADQSSLARQLAGVTYRPIPAVSLKVEINRYQPELARVPAYYGVTTSLVWFFNLP
jgi:hypothetical protein